MASLATAVDTEFTPSAGDFIAQVTGAGAALLRKNASGVSDWAVVGSLPAGSAVVVANPVAGAVYKFSALGALTVVRADQ